MSKKQHYEFLRPLRLYTPICMNCIINTKVSSGEVANASAILGLLYKLSSQKDLCHLLLVLESTFQVPKEQNNSKRNSTMTMGMQRLSQILNRNSEKLFSVSLLSEQGAVKAFSWAMGSLCNSTANLQTHSRYQRREKHSYITNSFVLFPSSSSVTEDMREPHRSESHFLGDTNRCDKIFTVTKHFSYCLTDKCHALNPPVNFSGGVWQRNSVTRIDG